MRVVSAPWWERRVNKVFLTCRECCDCNVISFSHAWQQFTSLYCILSIQSTFLNCLFNYTILIQSLGPLHKTRKFRQKDIRVGFLNFWWYQFRLLCWRRQWFPVLLPGKSHGQRSLVGSSPRGCWESDMTERLHFHFSLSCIGEGNGNPLQCSCLENPRDGRAWWAAVYGVSQSRIWLKWLSSSSTGTENRDKYQ